MRTRSCDTSVTRLAFAAAALVAVQVAVLWGLGQPLIAASGRILLWAGNPLNPNTSQQLSDWYSFSHVIHGFLFYALLHYLTPRLPLATRLLISIGIEIGWEIAENTPMAIEHYRRQALAVGYAGDSILNSVIDTVMMVAGFFLAARMPVWVVVALGIGFELFTGYMIHDGLALNILGFVWTPDFIARWQTGS